MSKKPIMPKKIPSTNWTSMPENIFSPRTVENREIRYNNSIGNGSDMDSALFKIDGAKLSNKENE